MQEEDIPKKSFKERIKPNLRQAAFYTISGIAGGATVALYFKHRTVITFCHITMDQIDQLKDQGQGVIGFAHGSKNPIYVALPDKV